MNISYGLYLNLFQIGMGHKMTVNISITTTVENNFYSSELFIIRCKQTCSRFRVLWALFILEFARPNFQA